MGHYKYCTLYGGSRSGKSFSILYAMTIRASKEKSKHLILRRHFNSVKRSIAFDTFPKVLSLCFPGLTLSINRTDWIYTFPNGSEIHLGGLDNKERADKILGLEYSSIWFNECSEIDYSSVQVAISRLAEKNGLSKKVYFDMNPNEKNAWPYQLFIQKLNPIDGEPISNPEDYGELLMNPSCNLDNIDPEYLAILDAMPEKQRNRFLNGQFSDSSEGSAYYGFNIDKHVLDDVPRQPGTVFIGTDYNVSPTTSVVFQYINNRFVFIDEVFMENGDTYRLCDALVKKGYKGASVIPDSTGKNRKTSGKSDFDIMREYGFNIISVKNPYVMDRINNANRIFSEDRVIISRKKCPKLINDFSKVVFKDGKLDQRTDKFLTHLSDGATYGMWRLDPISTVIQQLTHSSRR